MRNLAKAAPLQDAARAEKLPLIVRELDVTRQDSIDRAVAATLEREGPIDVLVNNAGIGGATPLELTPEDEHRAMFEANYWGPIRMIHAVLPSMRERRGGCIVNVTSIAGRVATPNQIPYSASKHALAAASEALAHEVFALPADPAPQREALRARISDEEWVAMGGELSDEEYNARFKRYFGIDL